MYIPGEQPRGLSIDENKLHHKKKKFQEIRRFWAKELRHSEKKKKKVFPLLQHASVQVLDYLEIVIYPGFRFTMRVSSFHRARKIGNPFELAETGSKDCRPRFTYVFLIVRYAILQKSTKTNQHTQGDDDSHIHIFCCREFLATAYILLQRTIQRPH